jgi:hypothetical protein
MIIEDTVLNCSNTTEGVREGTGPGEKEEVTNQRTAIRTFKNRPRKSKEIRQPANSN